jgi:hypothetical protein
LLDADEFLDVKSRDELHGPRDPSSWINLTPSEYGEFERFDAGQLFTPHPTPVRKVALSARYALIYPDFYIEEANHNVSRSIDGQAEAERLAFPILHVPVRSAARLGYRLTNSHRLLASKHNTSPEEGHHVGMILGRFGDSKPAPALMDSIASSYGVKREPSKTVSAQA